MMLKSLMLKPRGRLTRGSALLKMSQASTSLSKTNQLNVRYFSTDPVNESSQTPTEQQNDQPKNQTNAPPRREQQQQQKQGGLFKNKPQDNQRQVYQQQQSQSQFSQNPNYEQQRGTTGGGERKTFLKHGFQQRPQGNQKVLEQINEDESIVEEYEEFTPYDRQLEAEATESVKALLNKYQNIKGEWTEETIDKFIEDLVDSKSGDAIHTNQVSYEQLKQTGLKEYRNLNPDFQNDFTEGSQNLKKAFGGHDRHGQKKEKSDVTSFRFLQKVLGSQNSKTNIDMNAIKDAHQHMQKYIELIGSQDFQEHLGSVLTKYDLTNNLQFQELIIDLFINTTDTSQSIRLKSVVLERFLYLLLQLDTPAFYKQYPEIQQQMQRDIQASFNTQTDSNGLISNMIEHPDFMLQFNLLSLAKNHNYFGEIDNYMKRFSKIILKTSSELAQRLENALQKEIVIKNPFQLGQDESGILRKQSNFDLHKEQAINNQAIAQPGFQFLPRVMKIEALKEYSNFIQTFHKTKETRFVLDQAEESGDAATQNKLMTSIEEFQKILTELDKDAQGKTLGQLEVSGAPLITMAQDTLEILSQESAQIIRNRYGFDGISLTNLEDLYDPNLTGMIDMIQTRSYLLQKGMTAQFADQLAKRYIDKHEPNSKLGQDVKICTILDLFDSSNKVQAIYLLNSTSYKDLVLNYMTWGEYKERIHESRVQSQLKRRSYLSGQEPSVNVSHFSRSTPLRPIGVSARAFTTSNRMSKEEQREAVLQQEQQHAQEKPKSKFIEFIQTVEELDKKPTSSSAAQVDYDLSELDISFDKVQGVVKPTQEQASTDQTTGQVAQQQPAADQVSTLSAQQQQIQIERQALINKSLQSFNINFFKNFAFSGPDQATITQKSFEEFILNMDNPQEIQQLIVSMLSLSYEINSLIPNIEMLFYKMFTSPIITKEQRKGKDTDDNILLGNIFAQKEVPLSYFGYKSLLETLILQPKKKHFKKVVNYILKYEKPENVDPEIIDMIVRLGIDQKYPIFLGQTVKYFVQHGYNITLPTFQKFIIFLEKCKGFEEDAKRFVFLTTETENLEFSYKLIQPIFTRNMQKKSGNEILKLFEQFRKNIKLNKKYKDMPLNEKTQLLQQKKREFYDGLLADLISMKAYGLAQIVYSEKTREKFDVTINDNLTGLKIFSNQRKLDEYVDLFNKTINDKDGATSITADVCNSIAQDLQLFDTEKEKAARLDMTTRLKNKVQEYRIFMTPELFNQLVYLFTETQQWGQVIDILNSTNPQNSKPDLKTLNYIKKNLLYVFEQGQRNQLKAAIENIENTFFSKAQLVQDQVKQQKRKTNIPEGDRKWKEKTEFSKTAREKAKQRRGVTENQSQSNDNEEEDENMA